MPSDQLRRLEFLGVLGGGAMWPLAASAQQRKVPVVGFLDSTEPFDPGSTLGAFRAAIARAWLD
jgi:hypothetical protein